jgi:hypothetical protein
MKTSLLFVLAASLTGLYAAYLPLLAHRDGNSAHITEDSGLPVNPGRMGPDQTLDHVLPSVRIAYQLFSAHRLTLN